LSGAPYPRLRSYRDLRRRDVSEGTCLAGLGPIVERAAKPAVTASPATPTDPNPFSEGTAPNGVNEPSDAGRLGRRPNPNICRADTPVH